MSTFTKIELSTGGALDCTEFRAEAITLHDVAEGISKMCRFGGQVTRFYSVAEHAGLVAGYLADLGAPPEVQLAGLHHDDHEGLGLCDIPRPFKRQLGGYTELANHLQATLEVSLGLNELYDYDQVKDIVKRADNWALFQEAGELLPSHGESSLWLAWSEALDERWDGVDRGLGLPWERARDLWLMAHETLVEQCRGSF